MEVILIFSKIRRLKDASKIYHFSMQKMSILVKCSFLAIPLLIPFSLNRSKKANRWRQIQLLGNCKANTCAALYKNRNFV